MNTDPEITLRLPQSALQVVLQHLYAGRYETVAETIQLIVSQAAPQFTHLAKIAEAEAAPLPSGRAQ
jgi:hypothetical protein